MKKQYGSDLKKDLQSAKIKLNSLEIKINKRFNLILDDYRDYLSDSHRQILIVKSIEDFNVERKLAIIIQTEANYVEATGNQLDIFN